MLNIWDYGKLGNAGTEKSDYPPGLFFRHAGHRDKVVDFHWNAADPWTIVSVSEDGENTGGGGTLQLLDTSFFHADPHPGNLIRTPDEKQLYWILVQAGVQVISDAQELEGELIMQAGVQVRSLIHRHQLKSAANLY